MRAPAKGLWQWAENGAVLVWHDGTTIAFRQEISQILEWLAPNGLPSFDAIVFLLAACRGKVPKASDIITEREASAPSRPSHAAVLQLARRQLKLQLQAALGELAKLSQLPAELKSGIKAKCVLAEAAFEAPGTKMPRCRALAARRSQEEEGSSGSRRRRVSQACLRT